jgi:hypothetical protein
MYKCTVSGSAVLEDGTRLSYREYVGDKDIRAHPHWTIVRMARFRADNGKCVLCHCDLVMNNFQTHHVSYERLGHERLRDVITLCSECHEHFHETWKHGEYYKEQDDDHWETFSLPETVKLCAEHFQDDYWFGGDLDCCSLDVCRAFADEIETPAVINPEDIQLFFRNKRYEVLFAAESVGIVLDGTVSEAGDEFLDGLFGKKGGKGGNPKRSKARIFMTRHNSESFHRNYWYLRHINILLQEVKNYEQAR